MPAVQTQECGVGRIEAPLLVSFMIFSFASWNLNARRIDDDSRLLAEYVSYLSSPFPNGKRQVVDIVALQEVRRSTFEQLSTAGKFAYQFHFT